VTDAINLCLRGIAAEVSARPAEGESAKPNPKPTNPKPTFTP
jgi:hypothetical protein